MASFSSCIQEFEPQSNTVTIGQASSAPNSFDNFANSILTSLNGRPQFYTTVSSSNYWDFGYPSQIIQRDIMGQDIAYDMNKGSNYQVWYSSHYALGPDYLMCQIPWRVYYGWINNCNTVIGMLGDEPTEAQKTGAGIAYAMRAMFYEDIAQMYANETYGVNKEAETVPLITEDKNIDMYHNPRATNEKMWSFILSDLDKAEEYLADYDRGSDKTKPNLSVVYGLKARAYLVMCDWQNAEKYAKLAQTGYTVMSADEYTDRNTGFNTPNDAWMFCVTYKADDPCLLGNDADGTWGSQMTIEISPTESQCGYASNYGDPKLIDKHLYTTIPSTDCRKKCFVDFAANDLEGEEQIQKLSEVSDYPIWLLSTANAGNLEGPGGLSLKFRAAGGEEGHKNQYVGFLQSIPLMRVEEMKLIEAEAAGMQDEARGKTLLEAFAKTRDPQYVYGKHNEAYGNKSTSAFQNEVWWQRRVELWGEGFATFDIKRLGKGIIRSYAGTNHVKNYRWNTDGVPQWMTLCIVGTEREYNYDCTQNPLPVAPTQDSPEFVW